MTRVYAAPERLNAARLHAEPARPDIDYRAVGVDAVDRRLGLITAMEVIEHVADPAAFVASLAARLASYRQLVLLTPMALLTPNRKLLSRLITITLAEGFGRTPHRTHDYDKFIAPQRTDELLGAAGMTVGYIKSIALTPIRGLHLSEDMWLNDLVAAANPAAA